MFYLTGIAVQRRSITTPLPDAPMEKMQKKGGKDRYRWLIVKATIRGQSYSQAGGGTIVNLKNTAE
ncbi:MAG: hypothetical protein ABI171_23085 [Collimonas sp.]|uniref:hypothetical protein n=1 Tax=Collimonas sp. TaxID=1963772 RepID=UPI0032654437